MSNSLSLRRSFVRRPKVCKSIPSLKTCPPPPVRVTCDLILLKGATYAQFLAELIACNLDVPFAGPVSYSIASSPILMHFPLLLPTNCDQHGNENFIGSSPGVTYTVTVEYTFADSKICKSVKSITP